MQYIHTNSCNCESKSKHLENEIETKILGMYTNEELVITTDYFGIGEIWVGCLGGGGGARGWSTFGKPIRNFFAGA